MPVIEFTANLRRHLPAEPVNVTGATLREAMEQLFAVRPEMRRYVLDDQGAVRKHVVLFINSVPISDRVKLSDSLEPDDQIYVAQSLSGG